MRAKSPSSPLNPLSPITFSFRRDGVKRGVRTFLDESIAGSGAR